MAESIKIEIQGIDQFSPTFQAITKALQTVERGAEKTASGFSRLQASVITANQALDLMQRVLGPVIRGLQGVLETAGRFERLDMMLKRVAGSAQGAADAKVRLLKITNELPISLEEATRAFVKLETLGFKESERTIRALTNATAAFGGTNLELGRAIIAVQQIIGKGVVSMEEVRQQLGEAIPAAAKLAARELGITLPAMFARITAGAMEAHEFVNALVRGIEKDFGTAGAEAMDTYSGAVQRMANTWNQFLVAIGNTGVLTAATEALTDLTRVINSLSKFTSGLDGNLAPIFELLGLAFTGIAVAASAAAKAVLFLIAVITTLIEDIVEIPFRISNAIKNATKDTNDYSDAISRNVKSHSLWNVALNESSINHEKIAEASKRSAEGTESYAMASAMAQFDQLAIEIPEVGDAFGALQVRIVNVADAMGFYAEKTQLSAVGTIEAADAIERITGATDFWGQALVPVVSSIQVLGGFIEPINKELIELEGALTRVTGATDFWGQALVTVVDSIEAVAYSIENELAPSFEGYTQAIEMAAFDELTISIREVGDEFAQWREQIDAAADALGRSEFGMKPRIARGEGQTSEGEMTPEGEALLGIGARAASQISGVSGAIQGGQAGGPIGAIAGFLAEIILQNPAMQAATAKVNEMLALIIAPLAEAIAPTLEALAPLLKELAPVFKVMGGALGLYLHPLVVALGMLARAIDPLTDAIEIWIDMWGGSGGGGRFKNIDKPGKWSFASGGPLNAGQLAMVGERGPELFMPRTSGTVIPNHALAGSGVTINVMHPDSREVTEMVRRALREMSFTGRMGLV